MILTGNEISTQIALGTISISDFNPERLSPNAYDLRLGCRIFRYRDEIIDCKQTAAEVETVELPETGFVLQPSELWCAESAEFIVSSEFVPILHAKSGIARLGLFVHITADLLQVGHAGHVVFQLLPTLPVRVRPYFPIAQLSFWRTYGAENGRKPDHGTMDQR